MRLFNFSGENTEWTTFQNNPIVHYGRHSFFISDQKFMEEYSDFTLPEGYGIKVFKNNEWQFTDIVDAAIIQNIFWISNLAPRVLEILKANFRIEDIHNAYLIELLSGTQQKNIEELERVANDNFISINYGGSNLELQNSANWINGKYLDFGGFKIDKDKYKSKLIDKINLVTHYGHLVGDRHISYQSIDSLRIPGKRKTTYRIDKMKLSDIKFRNKSVIDIGCNLGLMLHYAKSRGAIEFTGYDLSPVIEVAKEYANYTSHFDFNFLSQDLRVIPPDKKADIVFYLAMSEYLGFPEWMRDITNEILIYEGHATTSPSDVETSLRGLFPKVVPLGVTEDRSVRPLFICYK